MKPSSLRASQNLSFLSKLHTYSLAMNCTRVTVFILYTVAVMINDVNPDNRTVTLTENRGVRFNLTIDVNGNPFPSYNWTRNGALVMNESTLTVAPKAFYAYAVRENTGFYEVIYVNRLGSDRYNFNLDIQCKMWI